jgi:hypothetical protein
VNTKSKPVLGLVRPKSNLDAPTSRFKSTRDNIDKFIGRQDLNLLLIIVAVTSRKTAVILLSPRSSTNITKVGVLPGVIRRKSLS